MSIQNLTSALNGLLGDKRTNDLFWGIVKGIVSQRSLCCSRIALSIDAGRGTKTGAKRIRRMVYNQSTKRSNISENHIIERIRKSTIDSFTNDESPEIWVAWDESEIRKKHAERMQDLMKVRSLSGDLVNGYRMLFGLAMTPGKRGLLQQCVFSSNENNFESQNKILEGGVIEAILKLLPLNKTIFHIFDRGHDDQNLWYTIWNYARQHVLVRLKHLKRTVFVEKNENFEKTTIENCLKEVKEIAEITASMKVQKSGQSRAKVQKVQCLISVKEIIVPRRQTYKLEKCSPDKFKKCSLVSVRIKDTSIKECILLTDYHITDKYAAQKIAAMYFQRWSIEDNFKFMKQMIGYEQVQLLGLEAVKNLLSMAAVALQYLFCTIPILDWPEIKLLARLGGWEERKNRKPGQIIITRGLQALLQNAMATAILQEHVQKNDQIPPKIQSFLEGNLF